VVRFDEAAAEVAKRGGVSIVVGASGRFQRNEGTRENGTDIVGAFRTWRKTWRLDWSPFSRLCRLSFGFVRTRLAGDPIANSSVTLI
jgi:hypothetical protein